MALFSYFRVIISLILSSLTFLSSSVSASIIGITSTPFGAGNLSRFAFITQSSSSTIIRAVKLGVDPATDNLAVLNYAYDGQMSSFLSTTDTGVGAFRGTEASGDRAQTTIIIHALNRDFEPSGGRVTVTANVGETVTLTVENLTGVNVSEIEWQLFSDFSTLQQGGLSYTIADAQPENAGYYGTLRTGQRAMLRYSLIKLIIRACPSGYYSPPMCNMVCPNCYNGGICSDTTGECLCAPGFIGSNCLTACGETMFGWDCSQTCAAGNPLAVCSASHACLPDPYGCSCLAGFTGNACDLECPGGTFGAGCTETCHCGPTATCDRFTGQCSDGQCTEGWSGPSCQVPDVCPEGYFGVNCTDLCNCLNNGACEKISGNCYSTGGLCMPGYASNEVQLADCQSFEGCFDNCSKTCHCQSGASTCDAMSGMCSGRCLSEWIGTACQTGVAHTAYEKVNAGQSTTVMCVYKSPLDISSLTASVRLGTAMGPVVNSTNIATVGPLFNISFVIPAGETLVYCEISTAAESASSGVSLSYFALPTLTTPPSVVDYAEEKATIGWNGWKAENGSLDGGEGPIVGYNIYYQVENIVQMAGFVQSNVSAMSGSYEYTVVNLSPGTTYSFSVSAVREGEGGEGPIGPSSAAVTLPAPMTTPVQTPEATEAPTTSGVTIVPTSDSILLYIIIPVAIVVFIIIIVLIMIVIGIQRRKKRKLYHDRRERIVLETQAMNEYNGEQQGMAAESYNEGYEEKTYLTAGVDETDSKTEKETKKGKAPSRPSSPPHSPEAPPAVQRPPSHDPRPIFMPDLAAYVQKQRTSRGFEEEWSLLPPDISQPCQVASLPANKVKNRYRNILAYDHSRVVLEKLKGAPNSDYINACYINSFDKEKMYIATQGPNKASLVDFWRMVWSENVQNVVMVTNLIEEGKNKCLQYWPEEGATLSYGSIQVVCQNVEVYHRYVIRNLLARNGSDSRNVKQFHYQGWPDKGVPKFAGPVLKMVRHIDQAQEGVGESPLLVHCSAGAGRTGVIIAVDSILREAKQSEQIDIFTFIKAMRDNRPQMVQTPEQYDFVHEAVLEGLLCSDTLILQDDIKDRVEQLQWPNPHTEKTPLQEEFEILEIISAEGDGTAGSAGSSPENEKKNRYPHIIPNDRCRPYLMTAIDNSDASNYINASFAPGYSRKNAFITTQMPLENTVIDFWRLVHDYHISTIVMLNKLDSKTCSVYWPVNSKQMTFGPFTVDHKGSDNMNRVKVRTLELIYKEEVHEIRQFEVQTWPSHQSNEDGSLDQCLDAVLQLMDYLHKCEIQRNEHQKRIKDSPPMLVHDLIGIEESGVFFTVMNCLQQLDSEGAVDVFQNLRLLRHTRSNLVPNLSDYLLCYQLINRQQALNEMEEESDYENRITTEALYSNVPQSFLKPGDAQSVASEC